MELSTSGKMLKMSIHAYTILDSNAHQGDFSMRK